MNNIPTVLKFFSSLPISNYPIITDLQNILTKRRYCLLSALLAGCCLANLSVGAQETTVKFDKISTEQGISQSSITCIYQDEEGFMWFGTYGGLNRFDGYNFIVNQFSQSSPLSISDNHVRSICNDTSGVLLVGTMVGLNRFFKDTRKFVRFYHDPGDTTSLSHNTIYKLLKDRDGDVWVGTLGGGLDKMERIPGEYSDEHKARYRFIHHKPIQGKNSISSLRIADMAEAPDGSLWIATSYGLNHYDKNKNEFTVYLNNPNDPFSIGNNDVSSVCVDKNGLIWAGTWGGGLNVLDPRTKKFTRCLHNQHDSYSLGNDIVMELFCDYSGSIWAGTWGGGLNRVLTDEEKKQLMPNSFPDNRIRFIRYEHKENELSSISANSIYSVFEDRTGVMWVGTDWGGLNKFERTNAKFMHIRAEPGNKNSLVNNRVFALMMDRKGLLWIGTQEGLNILNRKTNNFELFQYNSDDPNSISNNFVRTAVEDTDGTIWLGTLLGLSKYIPQKNNFIRYIIDPQNPAANNVLAILPAKEGKIWVGTYGESLLIFDPKTGKYSKYLTGIDEAGDLGTEVVWALAEDKKGTIWAGTFSHGLCRIDPATDKIAFYRYDPDNPKSLSNNFILSLYIDHAGTLWIGTSVGLNKLIYDDKGNPVFIRYYEEDGLVAQTVNGIIEDEFNHLWIATSKGLSMMDPSTGKFTNYYRDDGIQDAEFSINSLFRDPKTGEIYAGGINGFNVFHPGKIKGNKVPPETRIVDLKVFNKSVRIGDVINKRVILNKVISSMNYLELSYKEYVITFEYAALHFQVPQGNQYAFMLEGFDKEWNYVENLRLATYTNLPPGKYTFLVKAANNDGIWNEKPTKLELFIRPPWWKTVIFKILASLYIITILAMIFRLRIRMMQKRQHQLEQMVWKRTEELSKSNKLLEEKQQEISEANSLLEEKQEEISLQNEELLKHRNELESLIDIRTAELTEAKIKAEESDRLKSSFLANMSHEIRTPMNAIVGFASLLDDESLEPADKAYFIMTIKNNSDALLMLINDILDISLIEANQLVLFKEEFCVDDILMELYRYYELKNEKKLKIALVSEQAGKKTFLYNDPIRFRQIMTNLLNNAYKYTEHGQILFGYALIDSTVKFYVKDSGIGVSDENISKIFNYFHKIEPDLEKFHQGTGIGLSICEKLVKQMGGSIEVKSELSKGSVFSFTLPITTSVITDKRQEISDQDMINLEQTTILIAEDEPDNYYLIERILKKSGAKIVWAHNGKEAVDYFRDEHSCNNCLVFMDIKMPVMNGFEACITIKQLNKKIPIIALTAFALAQDKEKIMSAKFDDYISKPVNPERLWELLLYYHTKSKLLS